MYRKFIAQGRQKHKGFYSFSLRTLHARRLDKICPQIETHLVDFCLLRTYNTIRKLQASEDFFD